MHRTLDSKFGIILLALLVSQGALAGTIRKWTDENGNVVFGDAPVQGSTERVKVYAGPSGLYVCDESCRVQVQGIEVKERITRYMDGPACKFQYFKNGDAVGKDLALAAKQECATNKAMQDMNPNYTPKQDAYGRWQDHYTTERETRGRAVDRAVYQSELREINRNLEGVKDRQDTLKRCLKGYGCY